jgi:hypothetical protein
MRRLVPVVMFCALLGACAAPSGGGRLPDAPAAGEVSGTTGLSEASLRTLYGQPAFVRKDGLAQIWRFDGPSCKAFFFLYSKDSVTAVWHVETTPHGASIAADENCLSALRAHAASRPMS